MRNVIIALTMLFTLPSAGHAGYKQDFENEFLTKTWAGVQLEENLCISCHASEKMKPEYRDITEAWQASWHAQNNISCENCHGGDPRDAALAPPPTRERPSRKGCVPARLIRAKTHPLHHFGVKTRAWLVQIDGDQASAHALEVSRAFHHTRERLQHLLARGRVSGALPPHTDHARGRRDALRAGRAPSHGLLHQGRLRLPLGGEPTRERSGCTPPTSPQGRAHATSSTQHAHLPSRAVMTTEQPALRPI